MKIAKHDGEVPIKLWTGDMPIEASALVQLHNVAKMPFIYKHLAVMPDVHWGMGATVGSVIATRGAIIPAAVGVDIGCGMIAQRTSLHAQDLPDNLGGIRSEWERVIPHGRTANGRLGADRGAWGTPSNDAALSMAVIAERGKLILDKHPKIGPWTMDRATHHVGTLGSGNHFVELCLDEENRVWVMLHSGSRGIGNAIGRYFIERAKEMCAAFHVPLPDQDLAFLPTSLPIYDDYIEALKWAQQYASVNRQVMMRAALIALSDHFGVKLQVSDPAVNCHHNYVAWEHHFGENVIVTRKGAVRARQGDLGIIPGSMGARSFIVEGRGEPQSFCSCSHGAGRVMSRNAAKASVSLEAHRAALAGVDCRADESTIDETPAAYKDIAQVMEAQADLVSIKHTLKQLICVKG